MINPYKKLSKINPQREKGNRQIANDVYKALIRARLTGAEYQTALFIIDKSWGFNKNHDTISYSQIVEMTGLTRRGAINTIKKLEDSRIIVVERKVVNGGLPFNKYLFNKHYDTWLNGTSKLLFTTSDIELMRKRVKLVNHSLPDKDETGELQEHKLVNHSSHTKESITKESTSKQKQKINFIFLKDKEGNVIGGYWENITEQNKKDWSEAFPACDVELELKQMREWLISHPEKRKKKYRRFITGWLSRSQERGGTKRGGNYGKHPEPTAPYHVDG